MKNKRGGAEKSSENREHAAKDIKESRGEVNNTERLTSRRNSIVQSEHGEREEERTEREREQRQAVDAMSKATSFCHEVLAHRYKSTHE